MKFFTKHERPEPPKPVVYEPSKAEAAGYIPPRIQIERMFAAGQRLVASRKEEFDYPAGTPDDGRLDPTRSTGFDMADASRISAELKARLESVKKEQVKTGPSDIPEGKSASSELTK